MALPWLASAGLLLPAADGSGTHGFVCLSLHPGIGRGSYVDEVAHRDTFEARGLGAGISLRGISDTCAGDHLGLYLMPGIGLYASRSIRSDQHSIAEFNPLLSVGGGVIWRQGRVDCLFIGPEVGIGYTLVFDHDRILDHYHASADGNVIRFALLAGGVQDWSGTPVMLWAGYEWRYTGVSFSSVETHFVQQADYLSDGFTAGIGFGF